jgi:hypothetical protein
MHWRVPINDTQTNIIVLNFRRNADGHQEEQPEFPPVEFTPEVLPDGSYAMDSFFGQDKMAWETQGRVYDRSKEHTGASDHGIAMLRRMLLDQMRVVQEDGEPLGLIRDPERNRVVELPGWFVIDSEEMKNGRGLSRDLTESEGLLDERHQVFDVPIGAARPVAAN